MAELIPAFERASSHKVTHDFDGAIGQMTARVLNGEPADVVIVSGPQIDQLIQQSKVRVGTRKDLAKVGIGLFVRKGGPKPDVSSVEAFRHAMVAAKSIGWNDPAAGAPVSIYMLGVLQHLGIAAEMSTKTIAFKQRSERFAAVARGEVEIGFNQISEIIAASGVELVAPLPREIQSYTLFAAGIATSSKNPEAAKALIDFIASPGSATLWQAKGFELP